MIKDHGQYIHIYVSPRGKIPGEQAWVVNPVELLFLWMDYPFIYLVPEYSLEMI